MNRESITPPQGKTAFEEKYEIDSSKPLADFDTPGGKAFLLIKNDNPGMAFYGLVQHKAIPIRSDVYAKLSRNSVSNLICPLDRGLMTISLQGKQVQRLVTVFERPLGGPLLSNDGVLQPKVKPTLIRQSVVLSSLKALAALHKKGITHRQLTVNKLFFVSPDSDEIVLGECCTAPAGYNLPFGAEPLETAFADPVGRGISSSQADLFHLGVVLQSLYFGRDLTKGRERNSYLIARVNQGSFWANGGGQDLPGALGTLVRGLMADDLQERWRSEDILDWYEGLAKHKRTSMKAWSMNRPTIYKGIAYVDRRLLAAAFATDVRDAAAFLRRLDFGAWVQTSMREETLSEKMEQLLAVTPDARYGAPTLVDDARMVARICLFLHPSGPIYYKGLAIYPASMGEVIADAFARDDRDRITALMEMLDKKFLTKLNEVVGDRDPNFVVHLKNIAPILEHVQSKQLGKGLERALYMLNNLLPCNSVWFHNLWISSIKQMLIALDRMSQHEGARNILSDRHATAFISAHGMNLDRELNKLSSAQNDPIRFASLTVEFFAQLQRMTKIESLPNLTEKLADSLTPAIKGLKNKKRREKAMTALESLKKVGDISKLSTDLNLLALTVQDKREFSRAKTILFKLEREKARLMGKILPTDIDSVMYGYRGARILAILILAGVSLVMFLGP